MFKKFSEIQNSRLTKEQVDDIRNEYLDKTIRIIDMKDELSGNKYNGKTGKVDYVDDMGQLHGTWGSLAVIPGLDIFVVED